jgi:hypothetical protein
MAKKKKGKGGIGKREAVRRALVDLGQDATPSQMQGHIRSKYGIEMTAAHISTEKGNIRRKAAAPKQPAQTSAAHTVVPEKPAPEPVAAKPEGAAIGLGDIEAVKGLVGRVGAASLKKLIDVLAR